MPFTAKQECYLHANHIAHRHHGGTRGAFFAVYDINGKFKLLGRGTFGLVVTPPIACPEGDPRARRTNGRVGKLFFDEASADIELQRALLVQNTIDQRHQFTTTAIQHVCHVKKVDDELWEEVATDKHVLDKLQAVLDLKKAVPQIISEKVAGHSWHRLRGIPLKRFLGMLSNAAQALYVFAKHGFQHCDVTPRNLMWDEKEGVKLIDYGMTTIGSDVLRMYCMTDYQYFPPEFAFLGSLRTVWRRKEAVEPDEEKKAAILARQEVDIADLAEAIKAALKRYISSIKWTRVDGDDTLKADLLAAHECWSQFATLAYRTQVDTGTAYKDLLLPYVGKTDVYQLGVCVYEMVFNNDAIAFKDDNERAELLKLAKIMAFPTPGPRDTIVALIDRIADTQERLFGKRSPIQIQGPPAKKSKRVS